MVSVTDATILRNHRRAGRCLGACPIAHCTPDNDRSVRGPNRDPGVMHGPRSGLKEPPRHKEKLGGTKLKSTVGQDQLSYVAIRPTSHRWYHMFPLSGRPSAGSITRGCL